MTTLDLFVNSGRALSGNEWQSAVARDLGVSSRTVRRWAAGAPIPNGIGDAMEALLVRKREQIRALILSKRPDWKFED